MVCGLGLTVNVRGVEMTIPNKPSNLPHLVRRKIEALVKDLKENHNYQITGVIGNLQFHTYIYEDAVLEPRSWDAGYYGVPEEVADGG